MAKIWRALIELIAQENRTFPIFWSDDGLGRRQAPVKLADLLCEFVTPEPQVDEALPEARVLSLDKPLLDQLQ